MTFTSFFENNSEDLQARVHTFNCLAAESPVEYRIIFLLAKDVSTFMLQNAKWFLALEKCSDKDEVVLNNALFAAGGIASLYSLLLNQIDNLEDRDFFGKSSLSLLDSFFEKVKDMTALYH